MINCKAPANDRKSVAVRTRPICSRIFSSAGSLVGEAYIVDGVLHRNQWRSRKIFRVEEHDTTVSFLYRQHALIMDVGPSLLPVRRRGTLYRDIYVILFTQPLSLHVY